MAIIVRAPNWAGMDRLVPFLKLLFAPNMWDTCHTFITFAFKSTTSHVGCQKTRMPSNFVTGFADCSNSTLICCTGRDCERDVKRDRRKRKAAAEALTFASHGMNGSEGEAAGLLPAQQKPKRVRRRKSREQVIQPIAVDLQAVPPEQAPGVLGLEVLSSLPLFKDL